MKTLVRLRCMDCGYGVSVRIVPDACPMCRGQGWEYEEWRPFSALYADVLPAREGAPEQVLAGFATTAQGHGDRRAEVY